MSDGAPVTRWDKAYGDWPGFRWGDAWVAAVGLVLAVGVLATLGFPGKALEEVVVVALAGAAAALLFQATQLFSAWLQAPMRLLTGEVIAIRDRLDAMQVAVPDAAASKPPNVRLTLLNFIPIGRQHSENVSGFGGPDIKLEMWTQDVGVSQRTRWTRCGRTLPDRYGSYGGPRRSRAHRVSRRVGERDRHGLLRQGTRWKT